MGYDHEEAVAYAHEWAYRRNSAYYDFDDIGGDCTNFASQCIYNGCHIMNFTETFGWYYKSLSNRAPAWTGVPYLYNFLTTNIGAGPYGREQPLVYAQPGDVIQLSFDGIRYTHSPFVVRTGAVPNPDNILICAHTNDADNRPLSSYSYKALRLIHILGARTS